MRPWAFRLIQPAFRYSPSRGAYVLRLLGGRWGPVVRPGSVSAAGEHTTAE
ncbi:MAG TPA: hypothetical protein VIC05_09110 [Solirubrobacteraceae bacterium]|jgi:hypothetical protein